MSQFIKFFLEEKFLYYIIVTFPLSFVIGNALVNSYLIIFLLYFLFNIKKIYYFFDIKLILIPMLIWIYLIINTSYNNIFFSDNINYENILKSVFYLRILILPITLAYFLNIYPKLKVKLLYTLILISLIISVDVIFQFNFGFNLINLENSNQGMRNSSFFGSELISGSFLSKFLTLSIAFTFILLTRSKEKYKYLLIILPILIVLGVILSGERMAFLNAIFSVFLFALLSKNKKIFTFFIIILITIALIVSNSENLKKRYLYNTGAHLIGIDNAESLDIFKDIFKKLNQGYHAKIFSSSIELSQDNFIFGKGLKSYRYQCVKLKKSDCSTHPHNMFLEIIHDGGIILLVLFYYFFILMIMNNIKSKQKNYYDLSIIAILLTFINPIQITGSIFSTWHASIIFFIFGLTLISKKNEH